jgi:uncharacterized protein YgfB (UPF0149 family)
MLLTPAAIRLPCRTARPADRPQLRRRGFDADAWLADAAQLLETEPDNVRNALIGLQEMVKGELTGDDVVVLLLPTDDAPLADRAAALGQWCQGFHGFGLNAGGKDLSDDAKEVLQDLAAISQVQEALEESEDGEGDYMEVMEYLRVAPLLLFSETKKPLRRSRPSRRCTDHCTKEAICP